MSEQRQVLEQGFATTIREVDVEIAAYLVVRSQFGSMALLQRLMRINYSRAVRIMGHLERLGIVEPGAQSGVKARDVLIPVEQMTDLWRIVREGWATDD